jgi:hypothetical protein
MVAFEMVSAEQKKIDSARKSLGQQGFAAAINGLVMARGKLLLLKEDLASYGAADRPDITLVRGYESLATHRRDYETLAEALRDIGASVTSHEAIDARGEQAIGHSHLVPLGRMALVSDWVGRQIVQK